MHRKTGKHDTFQSIEKSMCAVYTYYRYIDVAGPAAAGEMCAEIGYTFIQTGSDSP